ncbi:MAG: thioredoxin, partial [Aquabacterium sp.]|nr:thioredoxin [Aquabacterium sp.]
MLDTPSLDIVCLCADWCGTCREYAQVFEALQQALPAHRYR